MKRREFIALVGGTVAWPHSLLAQGARGAKPFRIVTLPDIQPSSMHDVFIDAMRQLDWIEGRDFVLVMSGFQWGVMDGLNDVVRRLIALLSASRAWNFCVIFSALSPIA